MTTAAIITLLIVALAIILFVTEVVSIDVVAISLMVILMLTGVVTVAEGLSGFSNPATITVAFMFILSGALLKTGALQYVTHRLTRIFIINHRLGILLMMVLVASISAFVNNTPVVAVFIPVVIQIANASKINPAKLLIPLSFASIMGGMCTLLGTSTNLLVNGIALREGVEAIGIFEMSGLALILLFVGILYMVFIGYRLLPSREPESDLKVKFGLRDYLTDIEIMPGSKLVGIKILESSLVRQLQMDILEIARNGTRFTLPPGDFVLQAGDILKTRCSAEKMMALKDQARIITNPDMKIGDHDLGEGNSTLVEMVITSNAAIEGQTLREADFRRRFRAAPLAIRHREEVLRENLYDVVLRSGDVILAEVKSHFVHALKLMENEQDAPFAIISQQELTDFDRRGFWTTISLVIAMVILAAMGWVDITAAAIAAVILLVFIGNITMKEAYEAVNWKIVFVLAGVLSLGIAMKNSGLDLMIANLLTNNLGTFGPVFILSGIYFATSLLTEVMSNNATAALMAPIGITIATTLGISPTPFLIAIMFAASASFMTPIGYQTNTMVYSAGQYKFTDFIKVGFLLNLLFWIISSFLIPLFFPF
ncbi:SLC13 family permease [Cryomorpha ignava]|uniref:SLC13 family permease n=1 Tax=Cryomorpha ignava TaxID=101383 RepID=A0A7K3WV03_9FLAO|nr:SLC13 family permease [Cryomorpha ignava]NEN25509.1 SLC13 family permease [Cryomorpha ignava]